ncbi:MAG: hypothetical protein ACT4PZ_08410 [Panacagrimonas sp.]
MNPILILLLVNLAALAVLMVRFAMLRAEIGKLRARSEQLATTPATPVELTRMAREGAAMLSIRILNPMELAAQKHWVAGMAGRLTPSIVRRIVSLEAAKIVRLELPKYGVVAEVKVVGDA